MEGAHSTHKVGVELCWHQRRTVNEKVSERKGGDEVAPWAGSERAFARCEGHRRKRAPADTDLVEARVDGLRQTPPSWSLTTTTPSILRTDLRRATAHSPTHIVSLSKVKHISIDRLAQGGVTAPCM